MNLAGKRNRQWWIPSLIILIAILALGMFLPGLINPSQITSGGPPPVGTNTPTRTATVPQQAAALLSPSPVTIQASAPSRTPPSLANCTYSMYYWTNQPGEWMIENLVIGTLSYTKAEAILILQTESEDAKTQLLQQFFAALLNSLRGADSSTVSATLSDASEWLGDHTLGVEITPNDRLQAQEMAQTLWDYNTGVTGPGQCTDEPTTPTPLPTATSTPTQTPTNTPIRTLRRPSPTATQDKDNGKPTDEPTKEPTQEPTKPPKPTNTPKPRPTPTPAPPPTEAPTEPPPPAPNAQKARLPLLHLFVSLDPKYAGVR